MALVKFIVCSAQPISLWTGRNRQGYLGVTCSWIDPEFKIHEILLSLSYVRYPHTAEVIQEKLEKIMSDWGLTEKVHSVTTDNGANMKAAINRMANTIRIPCTAHTLQLVVGKGLMPVEVLVARAKQLINFFMALKQNERLEEAQKTLKILDKNVIKKTSTYLRAKRMYPLVGIHHF